MGLEQSVERKRNYSQFQAAIKQLQSETDLSDSVVERGRSLKLYARKSWEVLGEPTPAGWVSHRSGFLRAKLEPPCFLGPEPTSAEPAVENKEDLDM